MDNLTKIILAIIALIAAVGITITIKSKKNKTIQKNNNVSGDMAGRDIRK